MWTDPIVAQIHQTRADITRQAGDNSHAITLAAQRMAQEAAQKFGVQWNLLPLTGQKKRSKTLQAQSKKPTV